MEEKLNKYFATLRHFSHVITSKLVNNGKGIEHELKLSQLRGITAFEEDRPHTMNELANKAMVKLPNMTTMVDSLIKDGIVVREKSETDRRKILVSLTPKGKKIRTEFLANRRKVAKTTFSMLSEKDKKELLSCLDRACKILEKTIDSK